VGVYRLWRDSGFAVGALLVGFTADLFGIAASIRIVAALTALSGLVVLVRMHEVRGSHGARSDAGDGVMARLIRCLGSGPRNSPPRGAPPRS
jgi:hypothetical protein